MAFKFDRPEQAGVVPAGTHRAYLNLAEGCMISKFDKETRKFSDIKEAGIKFKFWFGNDQEGKPVCIWRDVRAYVGTSQSPSFLVKLLRGMSPGVSDAVLHDDRQLENLIKSLINKEFFVTVKITDKGKSVIDAVFAPPVASAPQAATFTPQAQPPAPPPYHSPPPQAPPPQAPLQGLPPGGGAYPAFTPPPSGPPPIHSHPEDPGFDDDDIPF